MRTALWGLAFLVIGVAASFAIGQQEATSADPCRYGAVSSALLPPEMTPELEVISTESKEELLNTLASFYTSGPAPDGTLAGVTAALSRIPNNTDRFAQAQVNIPEGTVAFIDNAGNELAKVTIIEFKGRWLPIHSDVCEATPGASRFELLGLYVEDNS
ncbi:MAG: hypothetical protein WD651_15840 [Acidimicrobiia bacterium]